MDALIGDHDLTLMLFPYILEICLQKCSPQIIGTLTKDVNDILSKGIFLYKKVLFMTNLLILKFTLDPD